MSDRAFDISAAGMAMHRAEMDAISLRLASAGAAAAPRSSSSGSTSEEAPLAIPQSMTFASVLDGLMGDGEPSFDDAGFDAEWPESDAGTFGGGAALALTSPRDASGSGPDDSISQMVALVAAGRAYDADVSALQAAKQMDVEAIDVDRQ